MCSGVVFQVFRVKEWYVGRDNVVWCWTCDNEITGFEITGSNPACDAVYQQ